MISLIHRKSCGAHGVSSLTDMSTIQEHTISIIFLGYNADLWQISCLYFLAYKKRETVPLSCCKFEMSAKKDLAIESSSKCNIHQKHMYTIEWQRKNEWEFYIVWITNTSVCSNGPMFWHKLRHRLDSSIIIYQPK